MAVELIYQAHQADARYSDCLAELGISIRTFERWRKEGEDTGDMRQNPKTTIPTNTLSAQDRQKILDICHQGEFSSVSPSQIVTALADRGIYLGLNRAFTGCREKQRR